jgi:hypothetical protein
MKKDTSVKLRKTTPTEYQVDITLEDGSKFLLIGNIERSEEAWEVGFVDEKGSVKISPKNRGVALELFSALPKAVEMFIKAKKPSTFYFTSDKTETSRVKLYKLLAKKIAKHGYILKKEDGLTLGGEIVFLFDKEYKG